MGHQERKTRSNATKFHIHFISYFQYTIFYDIILGLGKATNSQDRLLAKQVSFIALLSNPPKLSGFERKTFFSQKKT
jgi:hypothetical protein